MTGTDVSVVMPLYNEAAVIGNVIRDVQRYVLDVLAGGELIVIDDRGNDGSADIVRKLAVDDPRIVVFSNERNLGHGPSVRRGLDAATGTWLLQLDSDGEIDLDAFASMWCKRENADLIAAERLNRGRPRLRRWLSRVTNAVASLACGSRLPDANAGCKLIRRSLYSHLRPAMPPSAVAPSILLIVGARRAGAQVVFVDVRSNALHSRPSSLQGLRLARLAVRALVDTIAFRMRPIPPFDRER